MGTSKVGMIEAIATENTFYCGWKDDQDNVHDIREMKARTALSAKYTYIKDVLFRRFPGLTAYRASSLQCLIYSGTSPTPQRGRPSKPSLPNIESFYNIVEPNRRAR